jgi:hypothetical protein
MGAIVWEPSGKWKKFVGLFLMRGIQANALSVCVCACVRARARVCVCVCVKCIRILSYWLLYYQNRKTTDLFLIIWYAPDSLRILCFTDILPRTESTETVVEELFHSNDFDI